MAKYSEGINGPFSGKIGTAVGASWCGIPYMRSLPKERIVPFSDNQLKQQGKMALLRNFLLAINQLVVKGFKNGDKKTPMNSALSYNMSCAVAGIAPAYKVDFPKLLFTKGDLFCAWSPVAESFESKTIDFKWTNGPFTPLCNENDEAIMVIYCPEKKSFIYLRQAALRGDCQARMMLPESFAGHSVHCYLTFFSANGSLSSSNTYLGEITIA
ncbi:DUF6266 family protein [Pedobacter sp. MC2016-14]|uniref:DUF6266 family protein n=1 Tax=Pedobacter sp. MC2016-14 TaxID=2897327 RepID=UPI001E49B665|nr:DUF6266 family protein [Pedobacter sp. MC2016-14]MCD0488535.1 DUF6266 family protein [Pedobacter sp. MC2016-14]